MICALHVLAAHALGVYLDLDRSIGSPHHYDVTSLPYQIATKILADRTLSTIPKKESGGHTSNAMQTITADSSLYNDLYMLTHHVPTVAPE